MKQPLRRWLVVAAALTVAAAPVLVAQLDGGVAGATSTTDQVQYVQGTTGDSFQFVPGNGSSPTVQSLTFNGTCKTPSFSPSPLLAMSSLAWLSPVNGAPYTGPTTPESVGTNQSRTGVCETSPGWSISQNQSLTFTLGPNALVANRLFNEAKVPIQMNGADSSGPNTVTLIMIERNGSTVVGNQSLVVNGVNGTTATADTGSIASGFNSLELRIINPNVKGGKASNASVIGTVSLLLVRLSQTITFTNTVPASLVVGDSYTVTATGGASGNPVTFSVDTPSSSAGCTVNPSTGVVQLTGPAGTCVIDANQAGNAQYAPAPQVSQPASVGVASQTVSITSNAPTPGITGTTYTVTATGGNSGNPVTFSIDGSSSSGCTVSGDVVTFSLPTGTCVIDATQAGNGSYAPGNAQQTVQVEQTVCGQHTISQTSTDGASGEVTATFTFVNYQGGAAPSSICKTYSAFTASANNQVPGLSGNQTVTFAADPLATAEMTGTITWATQTFCTPDGSNSTPICPPTFVSTDGGQSFQPAVFCSSALNAGVPWCITGRTYAYTTAGTTITETWDGYGDPVWHHG
jgi:hypothetical protein